MSQQGDVSLFQTLDDGDINVVSGVVDMDGGLATMAYLCMFGGNEDDDGGSGNVYNWWGNFSETDPTFHYRSETQNLLQSLPATTNNLRRIDDAANRDLNVFIEKKIATSVVVVTTIPTLNKIKISIIITVDGQDNQFEFVENWKVEL